VENCLRNAPGVSFNGLKTWVLPVHIGILQHLFNIEKYYILDTVHLIFFKSHKNEIFLKLFVTK
jgi:hypothetical protein